MNIYFCSNEKPGKDHQLGRTQAVIIATDVTRAFEDVLRLGPGEQRIEDYTFQQLGVADSRYTQTTRIMQTVIGR